MGSIIRFWKASGDRRLADLERAFQSLGISSALDEISNAGTGANQALPVLAALLASVPGQMVYIEHPEGHLGTGPQSGLARVMAEAVCRGAKVIVETHSDLLIDGIRALAAYGILAPEMTRLCRFDWREDGSTVVSSSSL